MAGGQVTYFVVQPFKAMPGRHEGLVAEEAIEARSAAGAIKKARAFAEAGGAGIAFSRTGDPSMGDWQDAIVLGRFGEIPSEFDGFG